MKTLFVTLLEGQAYAQLNECDMDVVPRAGEKVSLHDEDFDGSVDRVEWSVRKGVGLACVVLSPLAETSNKGAE